MDKCGHCNGAMIIDCGDLVCRGCGYVADDRVAVTENPPFNEIKAAAGDRRQHGTGSTLLLHDRGISSQMNIEVDGTGKKIPFSVRQAYRSLQKQHLHGSVHGGMERRMVSKLRAVSVVGADMGLPDAVMQEAAYLCRRAVTGGAGRGQHNNTVAAACLYAVCRMRGVPRTIREFASVSGTKPRLILGFCTTLVEKFGLSLEPPDLMASVTRLANDLGVSERVKRGAMEIVREAEKRGVCAGKSPGGIAAGAIYMAGADCGAGVNQKDVARVSGMTEVTVRNAVRVLRI